MQSVPRLKEGASISLSLNYDFAQPDNQFDQDDIDFAKPDINFATNDGLCFLP